MSDQHPVSPRKLRQLGISQQEISAFEAEHRELVSRSGLNAEVRSTHAHAGVSKGLNGFIRRPYELELILHTHVEDGQAGRTETSGELRLSRGYAPSLLWIGPAVVLIGLLFVRNPSLDLDTLKWTLAVWWPILAASIFLGRKSSNELDAILIVSMIPVLLGIFLFLVPTSRRPQPEKSPPARRTSPTQPVSPELQKRMNAEDRALDEYLRKQGKR